MTPLLSLVYGLRIKKICHKKEGVILRLQYLKVDEANSLSFLY